MPKRQTLASNSSFAGARLVAVPFSRNPTHHLAHVHMPISWATKVHHGELGHLTSAFRIISHAVGWAVLIVFSGWATVALVLAILHVMNFWTLPGSP